MFGAPGPKISERCARRPSAAPRICRRKTRSCSRWRTRARRNGIAPTPPGSSRQFLLKPHAANYREFDERFGFLFNSYYVAAGPRHARPERGLITRPSVEEVAAYRAHVDAAVGQLLDSADQATLEKIVPIVEIGLHHEQQHQELMLTDILHAFAQNPTHPAYDAAWQPPAVEARRGLRRESLPASVRSVSMATASASTTSSRRIRCCCRRPSSRATSSPTASG